MDELLTHVQDVVDILPNVLFWAVYLSQDSCLFAAASLVSSERLPWKTWSICIGLAHCLDGYAAMFVTAFVFFKYLPIVYGLGMLCSLWFVREHIGQLRNGPEEHALKFGALGVFALFFRALVFSVDSLAYGPVVIGHSAATQGVTMHSHVSPVIQNALSSADILRASGLMAMVGVFITALMFVFTWMVNHATRRVQKTQRVASLHPETKKRLLHAFPLLLLINLVFGSMGWGLLFTLGILPFEVQSGFQWISAGISVGVVAVILWSTDRSEAQPA